MVSRVIRRIFIIVMLIALGFSAVLWFKYRNMNLPSSGDHVAPLFLDPEEENTTDEEDIKLQDNRTWDEEMWEVSDLSSAFEDEDFIDGIQNELSEEDQDAIPIESEDLRNLPVLAESTSEQWVVKVAEFKSKREAETLVNTLQSKEYRAFTYFPSSDQASLVYVLIADSDEMTQNQAEQLKAKLRAKGYKTCEVQKIGKVQDRS